MAELLPAEVVDVPLPAGVGSLRSPSTLAAAPATLGRIAAGRAVPEALVWNPSLVRDQLLVIDPDAVILQTARAYAAPIADGPWVTLLDFVDRLSVSYRQRSGVAGPLTSRGLRSLARLHQRFEDGSGDLGIPRVIAGRSGAGSLGIPWLPILAPAAAEAVEVPDDPEFDAVFFGSLNYPPNYEALEWLAQTDGIDRISVLVTGSNPHPSVRPLCHEMGWTFEPDYPDVPSLGRRAAVAIVPLVSAAGIQIKVLEAAAFGIPQVTTAMAMQGFDQAFPARVADGKQDFVDLVAELSKDRDQRRLLSNQAKRHVDDNYQAEAWVDDLRRLITAER